MKLGRFPRRCASAVSSSQFVSALVGSFLPVCAAASDVSREVSGQIATSATFSAEIYGGYLTGIAGEYVYNVPGDSGKLSQLNWQIDNAAILGGRLVYNPVEWLNLRVSGWSVVASSNAQDDFDWLAGYLTFDSWTHWSHSGDTRVPKAYQLDFNAAARAWQIGPVEISGLVGYRFLTLKMNDYGGHYIYSQNGGFRNVVGNFEPGKLGIAYQQWWHTPYLGLSSTYVGETYRLTAELIASPFVMSHDKDHHNLRSLVFKEDFSPTWMIGATLGAEYAVTSRFTLTARADYQSYFEAKGGTKLVDGANKTVRNFPKPAAGADFNALALTLGLKASL